MKKFISFASYQSEAALKKVHYEAVDNSRLEYGKTCFPIVPVVNGYLEQGEEFELIVITPEQEDTIRNCTVLKEEIKELCAKKQIIFEEETQFKVISVAYADDIDTQLDTFRKVIKELQSEDEIYACITYGSKPAEIVELMALRYARQIRENVFIGCIVYGKVDWRNSLAWIYDVTALVHLDDIIQTISGMKNPDTLMENLTI